MKEKISIKSQNGKINKLMIVFIIGFIIVMIIAVLCIPKAFKQSKPEIISKSTLQKIVNVSELSTFEAVYNGIAKVMNEEEKDEVKYYVSYDAKIKAGLDFEKVNIDVDNANKVIQVKIPEIEINDINVDITSLDYIFMDKNANTSTVSEEAYKKCIEDVQNETVSENEIYNLAEQNAHNIIEALISPFIKQLDSEYKIEID